MVRNLVDERLLIGGAAAKSVETNAVRIEINLAPDESMWPRGIHRKPMLKQLDGPRIAGTTEKDHLAVQRCLQVEGESGRNRPSVRARVPAWGQPPSTRLDVGLRSGLERGQRIVMEPAPHLGLPAPIEVLESILEPVFAGDGEDRRDAQVQTQAHDPTDHVGVLVRPLEPRVIIELRELGQADLLPVVEHNLQRPYGRVGQVGPRADQAAVQGDHVEHFNFGTTLQDQALDEVPAIEFRQARGNARQIPARRWRGPTDALPSIKGTSTSEHSIDRAERGRLTPFGVQLARNRRRTVLPECTGGVQGVSQFHDARFQFRGDPTDAMRPMRSIRPVDTVQPLVSGALERALHRAQANTKSPGDRPLRRTASHGHNERPTSCGDLFFVMVPLLMWPPRRTQTGEPVEAAGPVEAQNASTRSLENAQNAFPTASTGPHPFRFAQNTDPDHLSHG